MVQSLTTMLGVIKHLSYTERGWFEYQFAGLQLEDLPDDQLDFDFLVDEDDSIDRTVKDYEDACADSRRAMAGGSPDDLAQRQVRGEDVNLRWVMIHMIEETARHAGHLDILREQIDGQTGE